jgi:hypothetical protein
MGPGGGGGGVGDQNTIYLQIVSICMNLCSSVVISFINDFVFKEKKK